MNFIKKILERITENKTYKDDKTRITLGKGNQGNVTINGTKYHLKDDEIHKEN